MYDENFGENKWIPDNRLWSADLLKSKMSPKMLALIKDDLRSLYGINIENQAGPLGSLVHTSSSGDGTFINDSGGDLGVVVKHRDVSSRADQSTFTIIAIKVKWTMFWICTQTSSQREM